MESPVPYDQLEEDLKIVTALANGSHPESTVSYVAADPRTRDAVRRVVRNAEKNAALALTCRTFLGLTSEPSEPVLPADPVPPSEEPVAVPAISVRRKK